MLAEVQAKDAASLWRVDHAMELLESGTSELTEWDEEIIRQLVECGVLKESVSCQNLPKRGIKAVDVRCNVITQSNPPPLLLLYHILFELNTAPQDHKDLFL